jgi:hypothetical protein
VGHTEVDPSALREAADGSVLEFAKGNSVQIDCQRGIQVGIEDEQTGIYKASEISVEGRLWGKETGEGARKMGGVWTLVEGDNGAYGLGRKFRKWKFLCERNQVSVQIAGHTC